MEYTSQEREDIKKFWDNYYIRQCSICHGETIVGSKKCQCLYKAMASYKLELSGFGRKYLLTSLEQCDLKDRVNQYFNNFINYYQAGKGILVFGSHSTGKTLSVHTLAKNIMENMLVVNPEFDIKFFLYDDLVRFSYDDKSFLSIERIIKRTNILVLDNIGNETGLKTQARSSVSLLENIIRSREIIGLPTWLTTTKELKELPNLYSEAIFYIIRRNSLRIYSGGEMK